MAQKRMFSKDIVRTDKFLDMSLSSQALYFQLCMDADVKGFVSPRSVMRMINSTADDLNVLITKGFAIPFESGVVVITHWNANNNVRETRESPTQYTTELAQLMATEQGLYILQEDSRSNPVVLPPSIDKIRLDKNSIDEIRLGEENKNTGNEKKEFFSNTANRNETDKTSTRIKGLNYGPDGKIIHDEQWSDYMISRANILSEQSYQEEEQRKARYRK